MILNKKDAMLLNRPLTIDLRYALAKEYIQKQDDLKITRGFKNKFLNVIVIGGFYAIVTGILFILIGIAISYIIPDSTFANEDKNYYIKGISTPLPKFLYDNVKIECNKQKTKNKHHCLKTALSIAYAESTWGIPTNYFGIQAKDNDIKGFVTRYNKFWYKAKGGEFFYGHNGKPGKSRYCLSEHSSGSEGSCPNGEKNMNFIFLNKNLDLFINKK